MSASERAEAKRAPGDWWPGLTGIALATVYVVCLLAAERQSLIIALLAGGILVVAIAARFGAAEAFMRSFSAHEDGMGVAALCAGTVCALRLDSARPASTK